MNPGVLAVAVAAAIGGWRSGYTAIGLAAAGLILWLYRQE